MFHHLKPLYRDGLICHMQLAIPPGHRSITVEGKDPSIESWLEESVLDEQQLTRTAKGNLTMSALLWSSVYFSPLTLSAHVRSLIALNHLLPLQQQVIELIRRASNQILLEKEVQHFCFSSLLQSEQVQWSLPTRTLLAIPQCMLMAFW